jgi:hypothetical protein
MKNTQMTNKITVKELLEKLAVLDPKTVVGICLNGTYTDSFTITQGFSDGVMFEDANEVNHNEHLATDKNLIESVCLNANN